MNANPKASRVAAVVVSYNREELLAESIAAILAQTRAVDALVIVDNASTDDSLAVARAAAPHADVLALSRNTGGAGGFAVGIAQAVTMHDVDWVWIMDDDTVPTPSALAELLSVAVQSVDGEPAVLASRVLWTDGRDHPMNTPRTKPFAGAALRRSSASAGGVPVRSASFVSSMVSAKAIGELGYPIADYFLWNDDFEYSTRLIRNGIGIYCPQSIVVHKTRVLGSTDADPGARFYWEVRNKVWLFRLSPALSGAEKLLYLGASLRRWTRTFAKSRDRRVLRDGLKRGLRDGFRLLPRRNSEVLAEAGVPERLLTVLDAAR